MAPLQIVTALSPSAVLARGRVGRVHLGPLAILAVLVLGAVVASCALGAYRLPPVEVVGGLLRPLGIPIGRTPDATGHAVLWQVRLPRIALGLVVGSSLGCAGAVLQGVFRNPLAEPGIIGVSSGAALGAVGAIVLGASALGPWSVAAAAFVGGLIVTALVHRLARQGGRTEVVTLVLTGIAVNAFAGGSIGLLLTVADDAELRSITFWNLGSVGTATWPSVAVVAPIAVVGLVLAPRLSRSLDLLALGERPAGHLGVDVERTHRHAIALVALLTAAAVASAGIVGFIGLVVPHLLRLVLGPGHRTLVPASALGGALAVVVADLVARTAAAPAELPLGVLTALLGAPTFLWLLRRARTEAGGFA